MSSSIIVPLTNKSDVPSEKVKEASGKLTKKLDAPSEVIKKASWDLYDIRNPLVTNIETVKKEGTINTADKKGNQNLTWWRKT